MEGNLEEIILPEEEFIARLAHSAALETEGIWATVPGITDAINKSILGKSAELDGIRVDLEDGRVSLELFVEVLYGVKIPSVAWKLQENVKKRIEDGTGCRVDNVNVHVQRVHFGA